MYFKHDSTSSWSTWHQLGPELATIYLVQPRHFGGAGVAVEIKGSDAHANSEDTFNLKKSPDTAKAKIPEGEEDKQFKPDHFE